MIEISFEIILLQKCLLNIKTKWNHLSFVSISPSLVNITWIKRSSQVLYHENLRSQKFDCIKKHTLNWVFLLSCFVKKKSDYTVHIDWCNHSIHKHSSRSQNAPLLWHRADRGCIVVPTLWGSTSICFIFSKDFFTFLCDI